MAERVFVVLEESVLGSWAKDAGTFCMLVGLVGIGWALESEALQWIGAIMGFITIFVRASRIKTLYRGDAEGARDFVTRWENDHAIR